MDFGQIVEAILKIGLAPTLLILALFWYKERTDKTTDFLEEQNSMLLNKLLEEGNNV